MSLPVGFFAPLPLPMMIAFMGIQSAVMAEQFGTMFQYGKRRISAMSNEEFNKLTPNDIQKKFTLQLQAMIPEMEEQIKTMRPLAEAVLREFGQYLGLAVDAINPFTEGGPFFTEPKVGGAPGQIPSGSTPKRPTKTPVKPSVHTEVKLTEKIDTRAVVVNGVVRPPIPSPVPVTNTIRWIAWQLEDTWWFLRRESITHYSKLYPGQPIDQQKRSRKARIDVLTKKVLQLQNMHKKASGTWYVVPKKYSEFVIP